MKRIVLLALAGVPLWAQVGAAYPVNFGTAYVPSPQHGLIMAFPGMPLDGSSYSSWQYLGFGVTDSLSIGIDTFYLAIPGVGRDLANTTLYLNANLGPQGPGLTARVAPVIGFRSGGFGHPMLGVQGYFDRRISDRLMQFTAITYAFFPESRLNQMTLSASLDYRFLPWLGADLELLSGWPYWVFGAKTQLGLAPGLTLYLGPITLEASVRVGLVKAEGASSLDAPALTIGGAYGW